MIHHPSCPARLGHPECACPAGRMPAQRHPQRTIRQLAGDPETDPSEQESRLWRWGSWACVGLLFALVAAVVCAWLFGGST